MLRFILHRLVLIVPTFIGITLVAFVFIRMLPGDPVLLMAGERAVSPERHAELMAQFGFDRPLWQQYIELPRRPAARRLRLLLLHRRSRCSSEFMARFPATLELALCAIMLATVLGIAAGILAALRRGSWVDQLTMGTALVGYSMPIFWWALLLIILFSTKLGWTPVSGRISLTQFFPSVTGFMLIDSLLAGKARRLLVGGAAPDPADDRARHHPARGHRPADALGDARGAGRALRHHRPLQGADAAAGRSGCTRSATR